MKPIIRHGEDIMGSHKWGSRPDPDFQHIPPLRDSKCVPIQDKHTDRDEPLQLRKPAPYSSTRFSQQRT